jgi:hypothetical protein
MTAQEMEGTMKRFTLRFGLPVVCLLLLASAFLLAGPRHNITVSTCRQLKVGMSEDEIVALLGIKAGDYSGFARPKTVLTMTLKELFEDNLDRLTIWTSNEFLVAVCFDESRKATWVEVLQLDDYSWWDRTKFLFSPSAKLTPRLPRAIPATESGENP